MERTRIAKVDDVTLARRGEHVVGTLHLTPHHLIFCYTPPSTPEKVSPNSSQEATKHRPREIWITYPIISFCTFKPSPSTSRQPSSIRLRCRDFTFICFYLQDDLKARDVYESIRAWTCKLGRIEKLYAFAYQPQKPEREFNGWNVYDAQKEFERLGIVEKGGDNGWRISSINKDYSFSPTYPALVVVPNSISDNVINYAGRYRSRARIPVLTYLHPVNNCSISRSSQPHVGIRGNRSIQDEKLVAAIFKTSHIAERTPKLSSPPSLDESPLSSQADLSNLPPDASTEALEDDVICECTSDASSDKPQIYGAQQHNLIVDARPTVNAYAMQAAGLGSENMDHYSFATKAYLGIDNIHVMRDSLNKVIDALKDSDVTPLRPNREQLAKTGWLKHISTILEGASLIVRQVGLHHSHVLIHCSDGWDRTSQLSALSQLCLDPYYRTLEGFMVLVEKDWLSFGHMFRQRSGFLSSEKWFYVENERVGGDSDRSGQSGSGTAFENAFLNAKKFFNKDDKNQDSFDVSDGEMQSFDGAGSKAKGTSTSRQYSSSGEKIVTKVKETSPVFHQFLDATYQLLYQYPTRFEFNERFLRRLLYHLYSCQYGTFLYNCEKERVEGHARERTRSVWDYFLSRRKQFTSDAYDSVIDDNLRGHERLIFPRLNEVRWWSEVFGRTDEEMNGTLYRTAVASRTSLSPVAKTVSRAPSPVVTGIETVSKAVGVGIPEKELPNGSSGTGGVATLAAGISSLEIAKGLSRQGRSSSPCSREGIEVEMQ